MSSKFVTLIWPMLHKFVPPFTLHFNVENAQHPERKHFKKTNKDGSFHSLILFSSADDVSSAELMVLLIVRRPSVNFCFKSLLLLQFLFDNSEFFTGETRHIVPPSNKAGISNFCLEFQKLQKFQISWKRYSSYSSYSTILNFLLEKLGI